MDPRLEGGGEGGTRCVQMAWLHCSLKYTPQISRASPASPFTFTMCGPCRTFSCKLPVLCNYTQLKLQGLIQGGGGGGGEVNRVTSHPPLKIKNLLGTVTIQFEYTKAAFRIIELLHIFLSVCIYYVSQIHIALKLVLIVTII